MFCGSLSGFSVLLLACTSPLNLVQFLVNNNGLELKAGLWTLCYHELCWSHTPKPPCECHKSQCHRPHFLTLLQAWLSYFKIFLDLRRVVNMTALFYWYPVYVLFPILGWFLSHMNKSCYYSLGRILLTFIRYYLGTGLDTGDPHDWYLSGLFIWTAPLSRWKLLIDIHRQALLYQSS